MKIVENRFFTSKQSSHTLYHHLIYFTSMGVTLCEDGCLNVGN